MIDVATTNYKLLFLLFILSACGSSNSERKLNEQALIDSVTKSTEQLTRQKIADEQQAKDDAVVDLKKENQRVEDKEYLNGYLAILKTELQVQQIKLDDLKSPKLLRSRSEKEDQLRTQFVVIQRIENEISEINKTLQAIQKRAKYKLPELVMIDTMGVQPGIY